jgi:hypothetical protein
MQEATGSPLKNAGGYWQPSEKCLRGSGNLLEKQLIDPLFAKDCHYPLENVPES